MGATTFMTAQAGTDMPTAFREACTQAAYESGHGGYTGTIAEKHEAVIIDRTLRWLTYAEAEAQKLIDANDRRIDDKWGPAGALPYLAATRTTTVTVPTCEHTPAGHLAAVTAALKASGDLKRGETVEHAQLTMYAQPPRRLGYTTAATITQITDARFEVTIRKAAAPTTRTVDVTVTIPGDPGHDTYNTVLAAVTAKVRLKAGETVTAVHAPGLGGYWTADPNPLPDPVRTYKTTTTAPKTKPETRYLVHGDRAHDTWDTGFPTQAAARAHALTLTQAQPSRWDAGTTSYTIDAVTRRTTGEPLVTVTRTLTKTVWTVRVTITHTPPIPLGTQPDGWLFFGWASE